jgi:hypothetical protein
LVTLYNEPCEIRLMPVPSGFDPVLQWGYSTPSPAGIREACDQIPVSVRKPKEVSSQVMRSIEAGVRTRAVNGHHPLRKSTNGKLLNMQGGFLIRHSRLTALGIMLCLLVALFAVEAKIGWFSPAGSASAQISFAKARPAETPKMLSQRMASPVSPERDFAGTALILAIVGLLLASATVGLFRVVPARRQVCVSPGFTASLFFRPPPAL